MAVLHFTDAQRDEQLLAGQKVAELALMHQASSLSWVSTGGSDGYFVNINLDQSSWRRKWQPTPVFLLGEPHERRSLAGCRPWGVSKSQTRLSDKHFIHK